MIPSRSSLNIIKFYIVVIKSRGVLIALNTCFMLLGRCPGSLFVDGLRIIPLINTE